MRHSDPSYHGHCFIWIIIAVILSQPIPPDEATSVAIILSNICSKQVLWSPLA